MKDYVKIPKQVAAVIIDYFDKFRKVLFDEDDNEKMAIWIKYAVKFSTPVLFAFIIAQKSLPLYTYPLGFFIHTIKHHKQKTAVSFLIRQFLFVI